jgi:hypothetical protein
VFQGSRRKVEETMLRYVASEVGPVNSRGVGGVIPVEGNEAHSKRLAVYRKEGYENDARHRDG